VEVLVHAEVAFQLQLQFEEIDKSTYTVLDPANNQTSRL
jgi:hypothetical protein